LVAETQGFILERFSTRAGRYVDGNVNLHVGYR